MNQFFLSIGFILLSGLPAWAATYTVPTENPELIDYQDYQISDFNAEVVNQKVRISYTLPLDLTGEPVHIVLTERKSNPQTEQIELKGEHGKASCFRLECQISYKHLEINKDALRKRLSEQNLSPDEQAAKIQLAFDFEGNPVGIIRLDQPLK